MRRFTTAITAAALGLSVALSLGGGSAKALTPGYDSAYQFESAFLSLKAGDSGTFSVFFANTGTTSWVTGAGTQVNLAVCADNKVTCNVASANAAWAAGWLSAAAYATHTKSVVAPGDFSAFTYNIKAPTAATAGTYRFNGDLVVASSGDRIHPEGYFQDASISGVAPPPTGALSITEDYPANFDNEVSTTVPGTGQHTFTVNTSLTGTLTFMIIASGNVNRSSDGTFQFCDTNQDKRADTTDANSNSVFFTAVNGASISQSNVIINQPIPSSGTMTVTVDSAVRNQRIRVIAWQDKNNNGQIDLTSTGDVDCDFFAQSPYDSATDGALASSGRKWYFGPQGQFGSQFGVASCTAALEAAQPRVFRHDTANQVFSSGLSPEPNANTRGQTQSLRFFYDANDIFKVRGTQVTLATFKSELTPSTTGGADTIVIAYDPNPAGTSTYEICVNKGADSPGSITAAGGNFDNGSTAEDVRITFTSPSVNTVLTFSIQRVQIADATGGALNGALVVGGVATCPDGGSPNPSGSATKPPHDGTLGAPANSAWTTVGATTVPHAGAQGTFTNFDLANGTWCFRTLVENPNTGAKSYSGYATVIIPATGDAIRPTSTVAGLTQSSGFADTLDTGDKLWFDFSETMSIAANATIRVTDSDCGTATNAGPATCSGGSTNTVADIVCGTNATCTLQTRSGAGQPTNNELLVTMNGNPTIVAAGSTAGASYSLVVTDSNGITDLSGNSWDFEGSADRLITGSTVTPTP